MLRYVAEWHTIDILNLQRSAEMEAIMRASEKPFISWVTSLSVCCFDQSTLESFVLQWYVTREVFLLIRSSLTLACSNSRVQTYGETNLRGPLGSPNGFVRSGYHSGGAAQDDGDSGHAI